MQNHNKEDLKQYFSLFVPQSYLSPQKLLLSPSRLPTRTNAREVKVVLYLAGDIFDKKHEDGWW